MNLSRTFIWRKLREQKILATHKRVAKICEDLIAEYESGPKDLGLTPKIQFDTDKIIWQYWGQGYDNVPEVVRECLDSVDKYATDFSIVRLSDENLSEYLDIPEFVQAKRPSYSRAHFADLLRLMLLTLYGGLWIDATIRLSGSIPEDYTNQDFFVFRRDSEEPDQDYWSNTYAYYFGWSKGFKVNILNSFIVSKKGNKTISDLCNLMLLWWRDNDTLPDYFFFQILFDTYAPKDICPIVSDTLPHYLQQSINDPKFNLMSREEILKNIPIHKLSYK